MTNFEQAIWQALPTPALVLDAAGCISALNPAAEQLLNASAAKLTGNPLDQYVQSENRLAQVANRVRQDLSPVVVRMARLSFANAADVDCDIHIAPIPGLDASPVLLLLQPRDANFRLELDPARRGSVRSAIGMAEMLAHEIKNPLAGVTGAAQLLAMELSADDREMTDLIVAESQRIVTLLDQVEQFGNLQAPLRRAVNVHDILERARKSADLGFGQNSRFEKEYDPSLPLTYVDSDQLIQVVLNLLKNASEACAPEGGNLKIRSFFDQSLRRRDANGRSTDLPIHVEIIDDGPGLPADLGADIFEPFVSGRENGTGLGLALANKIISDHGAWIGFTSHPGHTVFRLSLPVAADAMKTNEETT